METKRQIGPYHLLEPLGQGGTGVVYRAIDEVSEETVAIKLLLAKAESSPILTARFDRECELVGVFNHPTLMQLHAAGRSEGIRYLIMELIEGSTLSDEIAKRGPFPLEEALHIVMQLSRGIGIMHETGWVHRDIKPPNIMLDTKGSPKLVDYGLAERISISNSSRITKPGYYAGTPMYLAPEQLYGALPTPAMDVYALCSVLYELLSGEPVYGGDTKDILVNKIQNKAPIYDIHPQIGSLIEKGLRRKPEERQRDGNELANQIEIYIQSAQTTNLSDAHKEFGSVIPVQFSIDCDVEQGIDGSNAHNPKSFSSFAQSEYTDYRLSLIQQREIRDSIDLQQGILKILQIHTPPLLPEQPIRRALFESMWIETTCAALATMVLTIFTLWLVSI